MITAVIFDYGNVVSLPQSGQCYKLMQNHCGVPAEVFSSSFYKFRELFDLGIINGAELYARILKDKGFDSLAADSSLCAELAKYDMDSWSYYSKPVSDWALSLKKSGYKLGVLSNMPFEFLITYEKNIPVFCEANSAVFSCRENMVKPNPKIYRRVLDRLGIKAEDAVFFDDMPENITAAQKVGINGILWQDLEQAQKEFNLLLK